MSHTYTSSLYHCVFSTKQRRRFLTREIRERLWPFMGGIARANGFEAIEVGGHEDHSHALLSVPPKLSLAKSIQLLKGGSSKFVSESFDPLFEWQEGYGAFTIGQAAMQNTIAYIRAQEEHHRVHSFEEEYLALLQEHGIKYDARYLFG
jgi:Transposase and inactivated derivatives